MAITGQNIVDRSISNIKKTEGVLNKNVDVRNKLISLKEKYSEYKEEMLPKIGEFYQIDTKKVSSLSDGLGLLEYTYGKSRFFGDESKQKYFYVYAGEDKKHPFKVNSNYSPNMEKWGGSFNDYILYVNTLFNKDEYFAYNFINGILSSVEVEYAMRRDEVGVVKDLRVEQALAGEITTNPDSYKMRYSDLGEWRIDSPIQEANDTRLGIITSHIYPAILHNAANFNSVRNRGKDGYNYSYITPSMYQHYGNNLMTLLKLSDILRIDQTIGRTRDDFGKDAKITELSKAGGRWNPVNTVFAKEQIENQEEGLKIYEPLKSNFDGVLEHTVYKPNGKAYTQNNYTATKANFREDKRVAARVVHNVYNDMVPNFGAVVEETNGESKQFDVYNPISAVTGELLSKTENLFANKKISTMIGRFYTGKDYIENNTIDTQWHDQYGRGKGRTLLTIRGQSSNGITPDGYSESPYCRAWTYRKQYATYSDTIRPFKNGIDIRKDKLVGKFRSEEVDGENGADYLIKNSVLQENGLVKITPYNDEKDWGVNDKIKKCMFSIENLAWKDFTFKLKKSQIGPSGGRIMWFPPYDLDFQENINVSWDQNTFIGRGEKTYTYSNTDRSGQLSFTLLIDHPSVINPITKNDYQVTEDTIDEDILRFFAGCEPLRKKEPEEEPEPDEPLLDESRETTGEGEKVKFAVYFPNNYSGNYNPNIANEKMRKTSNDINGYLDEDWWQYLLFGYGVGIDENNSENWIGYECNNNTEFGLSYLINTNEKEGKNKYYFWPREYKIVENGVKHTDGEWYGGIEVKEDWFKTKGNKNKIFCYRTDIDLRQPGLAEESYKDSNTFGLNEIFDNNKEKENLNLTNTFSEVFLILFADELLLDRREYLEVRLGDSPETIDRLANLNSLYNEGKCKIESINVIGRATGQDSKNSKTLAKRRAKCILKTLEKKLNFNGKGTIEIDNPKPQQKNREGVNEIDLKLDRCAIVEIEFNKPSIENKGNPNDISKNVLKEFSEMDLTPTPLSDGYADPETTLNDGYGTDKSFPTSDVLLPNYEPIITTDKKGKEDAEKQKRREDYLLARDNLREFNKILHDVLDKSYKDVVRIKKKEVTTPNIWTYDGEYQFFKELKKDDPVLWKSINDKYKYFDPAFHSITPEGFNARLNFLQQCTRQGHTVSASDLSKDENVSPTAGNLAFGRMPVCVLRIGDFINSRIIIESMSINYSSDGMQWDLNPEGVGVQPMYAKISMNIVLLGGQSLNLPITRLQNAQTFDYYANTGVYDNRADRVALVGEGRDARITYKNLFEINKNADLE